MRPSPHSLRIVAAALLSTSALFSTLPVWAENKVGAADKVVNSVTGSVGSRQLRSADPVYGDESISAEANSHGELHLSDDLRVLVGENSTVVLDKFVVGSGGIEAGTLKIAKGAFRFISGGGKENIKIATPLATIGVRGTAFDVYQIPAGQFGVGVDTSYVVVLDGQVSVCSNGNCLLTQRRCDIIRVPAGGSAERAPFFLSRLWTAAQSAQFNLLYNQSRFGSQWRLPVFACSARAAQEAQNNVGTTNSKNDKDAPAPPEPPAPVVEPPAIETPAPPDLDRGLSQNL